MIMTTPVKQTTTISLTLDLLFVQKEII